MMLHTIYIHINALGLVVLDKMFSCFPYISLYKTCDPKCGPILGSRTNLNKLGRAR